ncbi:hypothetical protein SAMN05421505_105195 [Sinosporangium album]|uniref:Methyltransferase domain-containing protein n=1 Tax=Sinosporangium album TaxID=504805 RepID=A0A1G7VAK3_9ACTN|nr:hypothetical protein [Sinosporangium album]SDG56826.1 hypothetical protein SAMN05421505_105195 [Sinosporangium album]
MTRTKSLAAKPTPRAAKPTPRAAKAKAESARKIDALSWEQARTIAEICDLPERATVVCAGGGRGMLLAALLTTGGERRGVQLEHDEEVAATWATLEACGVADRCQIQAAKVYAAPPAADLYVLADASQAYHWAGGDIINLFDTISGVIPRGSWLMVLDTMRPDPVPDETATCDRHLTCGCPLPCFCPKPGHRRHPDSAEQWSLGEYLTLLKPLELRTRVVRELDWGFTLLGMDSAEEPSGFSTPAPPTRPLLRPLPPAADSPGTDM